MAIGVDIEDISRFENKSPEFINRIYTPIEIEYCERFREPQSHYAVRFCAKEAVIKALTGLGVTNIQLKEIEVYHNADKCPQIRILKPLEKNIVFQLSLSHDKTKAIAFVLAEICC